ncbi:MAG TPA: DUF3365 domain-containing protein [Candidatus Binatia bacterium]|nr:DUF3365 domain-containing protein [Candidatus Binatia bacterium]
MKNHKKIQLIAAASVAAVALVGVITGCSKSEATTAPAAGFTPKQMADALFTVMASDRGVYTKNVVQRLQNEDHVIKASEHWQDDKALPLPAQMFRMGAETVSAKNAGFTYALLSLWPINKQNAPATDVEKTGLKFVADSMGKTNYYATETLGGKKYFTAVYADVAVSPACVKCHNNHEDSPRSDFKLNDVMGGVVIRIPTE